MDCRPIRPDDLSELIRYFGYLSETTRSFFGPHPFDEWTLQAICHGSYEGCMAFVVVEDHAIIGYAVTKRGYSEGEWYRFPSYAIAMDAERHFLFAPSISDAHQSKGIGGVLLNAVEKYLQSFGATHLVLWGGVQTRNQRAVRYYEKHGFLKVGQFHHEGLDNWDMVKMFTVD